MNKISLRFVRMFERESLTCHKPVTRPLFFLTLSLQTDSNPSGPVNWTEAKHQQKPLLSGSAAFLARIAPLSVHVTCLHCCLEILFLGCCTTFCNNCNWLPGRWISSTNPISTHAAFPRCFGRGRSSCSFCVVWVFVCSRTSLFPSVPHLQLQWLCAAVYLLLSCVFRATEATAATVIMFTCQVKCLVHLKS